MKFYLRGVMSVSLAKNVVVVNPGFLAGSDTLLKIRKRFVVIRVGFPSHFSDIFDTFVCAKKIFWSAYSKLEVSIGKQLQASANV